MTTHETAPLFSVILTTHNRPAFLREALNSVLGQTLDDFECIVVDDCSEPPASVPDDGRFRLVRLEPARGCAGARNAGIEVANGSYLTFLDDDDIYLPEHLSLLSQSASPDVIVITHSADLASGVPRRYREIGPLPYHSIVNGYTPSMGQACVPRHLCGSFDTTFAGAQDVDWWLTTLRGVDKLISLKQATYLVRHHDGVRQNNGSNARLDGSYKLLEKHALYYSTHSSARWFRFLRIVQMETSRRRAFTAGWRSAISARTFRQLLLTLVSLRHALLRARVQVEQVL